MVDHAADVIDITKKLVSFNTINPPGTNPACPSYIEDYLKEVIGANVKVIDVDGVRNVVGTIKFSSGGKHLVFNGHWDVVPVFKDKWNTDPFIPVIKNNWLYGRGAADMKGGLAALLKATENLSKYENLQGTLTIMAVGDEEQGGHEGTEAVLNRLSNLHPDLVLIGEPTDLKIKIGRRGVIRVKLKVETRSIHAAWLYRDFDSSIDICSDFVLKVKKLDLNDSFDIMPRTSFAVTRFNAGIAINVVPKICELAMDIRNSIKTNEHIIRDTLTKILEELKEKYGVFKYNLKVTEKATPYFIRNKDLITLVEKVLDHFGLPVVYDAGGGASDGRHFIAKGVENIIELGPIAKNVHGENEAVDITSLKKLVDVYTHLGELFLQE